MHIRTKLVFLAGALAALLWTPAPARAQTCVVPSNVQVSLKFETPSPVGGVTPNDIAVGDFNHDDLPDIVVLNVMPLGNTTVRVMVNDSGVVFNPSTSFTLLDARDIVVADFDRNGFDDVAIAGGADGVVYVSLNTGGALGGLSNYASSDRPTVLTEGDFDNDGDVDLAVGLANGTVDTLAGNGTGTFALFDTQAIPVGFDMTAADVNRDGALDLVATEASPQNNVLLAFGFGDGKFDMPFASPTGAGPEGLTVADFDRDGFVDVVTVDKTDQTISFLKGDGTSTFAPPVPFGLGTGEYHRVRMGDFDRDGDPDLVVNDNATPQFFIFENKGAGGFLGPEIVASLGQNFDSGVADFDADGRVDLAITASADDSVELYLSDLGIECQNPSFAWAGRFVSASSPRVVESAFIDNDARLDLLVANDGINRFSVHPGRGDGNLGTPQLVATAGNVVSLAAADVDGDFDVDVLAATTGVNRLELFLNDGLGALTAGPTFPLAAPPKHVVLFDASQDGKPDVFVTLAANDVVVGRNDGTGLGYAFINHPVGLTPGSVSVGDMDDDGLPDMAVTESTANGVVLFRNTGGAVFVGAGNAPFGFPSSARLADLNGDEFLDLVVADIGGNQIVALVGGFGFSFTPFDFQFTGSVSPSPHGLAVGDFDGDGHTDVASANPGGNGIDVFFGNGSGAFTSTKLEMSGDTAEAVTLGDLDRDGTLDLVATKRIDFQLHVMLNDGNGGFAPPFSPTGGPDARHTASADFDGDGKIDVVVSDYAANTVTFFQGTGGGGLGPGTSHDIDPHRGPTWMTVDDFDNDGDPDVVVSAEGSAGVVFLPWVGGGFGAPILSSTAVAATPLINRAGDFNQDGRPDIAVNTSPADAVQILTGDGAGSFVFETVLGLGGNPTGLRIGDFNRDGLTDVAATQDSDNLFFVFHLTQVLPTLSFSPVATIGIPRDSTDFDVVRRDNNGYVEFGIPHFNGIRIMSDFLGGYASMGDVLGGSLLTSARSLDANRDGFDDMVAAHPTGEQLLVFLNDQTGWFREPVPAVPGVRTPTFLHVDDLDVDGRTDIAVVPDSVVEPVPAGVAVLLNTNCRARLFRFQFEPSTCDLPPDPFSQQPALDIVDDGDNLLFCELRPVNASLIGGPSLNGNTSEVAVFGTVFFTDLGVNPPGGLGLRLAFDHDEARRKLSRSFTQNPIVEITGPTNVCFGDTSIYMGTPGFDMYTWELDSVPQASMAPTIDLTGMSPGARFLRLVVESNSCSTLDSENIQVDALLSAVSVSPMTPYTVCPLCSGAPPLTASPTGGGAVTYQWGYRETSGGVITPIPGETDSTYTIQGPDFPTEDTYFVVVTVTPTCGAAIISNEVTVDVTSAASVSPVTAFTALSTDQQNFLEWAPPAGCTNVRIIGRPGPPFPDDPNVVIAAPLERYDFSCAGPNAFTHGGLTNGTKYYYSAFAEFSGVYSERRSVTGLPFDHTTGDVKWAFSTGHTSMTQAGIRYIGTDQSSVYVPTNDHRVYGVEGGDSGGQWLSGSTPFVMGGPSQSWPPTVNFGIAGTVNGAVYVSSQDGMLYVLDADDLSFVRAELVGEPLLQAGPAGSFFSAPRAIMLGARNTVGPNVFQSFDPDAGGLQWTFDNSGGQGGDGSPIGIVLSAASINTVDEVVYFGSHVGAGNDSLWAVDFSTGSPMLVDAVNVGDLEASPIYLGGTTPHVVIGTKNGDVELRDASNLATTIWSGPVNIGDGGVKGFVLPHSHSGMRNFMFSTASKLTSIKDDGPATTPTLNWQFDGTSSPTPVPNPSVPLYVFGTTRAYVGASNGTIVRLDGIDTATPTATPIVLGDGASAVGPPSFDIATLTIYVGTTEGVIYAIDYVP